MEKKQIYSDEELVRKINQGETALFEILIRRYNPYLYKTGRSYNYSHEDTQDLMQDTFVDAYMNLSKFEGRSSLKTWLIRIMLNSCYRKQQKSAFKNESGQTISESSSPMFASNPDTQKMIMNRELNSVIENALGDVPADYRMVFTLREINGLNVADTAQALGISEANVKTRLSRAKNMLRHEIEKSYSADDIFEFNLVYCDAVVDNVMARIQQLEKNKSSV